MKQKDALSKVETLRVDLYGSLALTGDGHRTPEAIFVYDLQINYKSDLKMGLEGETPENVDIQFINSRVAKIHESSTIHLSGIHKIKFIVKQNLIMHYLDALPQHPNGMRFSAFNNEGNVVQFYKNYSLILDCN